MSDGISNGRDLVPFYDPATDPVVFHGKACEDLEKCIALLKAPDVTLAEARGANDIAAKIAVVAKVLENNEVEVRAAETKLRGALVIGKLSLKLDKPQEIDPKTGRRLPIVGKTAKAKALAEAGISTSTAQRHKKLAGGRDPERQRAVEVVANNYFAGCRERKQVPTYHDLDLAIFSEVPPPDSKRRPSRTPPDSKTENTRYKQPASRQVSPETTTTLNPLYIRPQTYKEAIEDAAALLDDAAKKLTSAKSRKLVEHLAQRVRELFPPKEQLVNFPSNR